MQRIHASSRAGHGKRLGSHFGCRCGSAPASARLARTAQPSTPPGSGARSGLFANGAQASHDLQRLPYSAYADAAGQHGSARNLSGTLARDTIAPFKKGPTRRAPQGIRRTQAPRSERRRHRKHRKSPATASPSQPIFQPHHSGGTGKKRAPTRVGAPGSARFLPGLFIQSPSGSEGDDQKVMLQLSMRPVSPAALSFTRSFQVPLSGSLVRLTV